jgi:hypothetical protein
LLGGIGVFAWFIVGSSAFGDSDCYNVMDYGATGNGTTDDTGAIQAAVNDAIRQARGLSAGGSTAEPNYKSSAFITVKFPRGKYLIAQADGVTVPSNTYNANITLESIGGADLVGSGKNIGINLNGGGFKNRISKLLFSNFATAIRVDTTNKNESMLQIDSCQSLNNDVFLDTVGYWNSRSTMIDIRDSFCGDTRVFVKHYTDHMNIRDCWMYPKQNSFDALLYLSGDGEVSIENSFFIPHGAQISPVSSARFIDFVSDSAQGTGGDRSVKSLKISHCRASLESARPFIWTFDDNPTRPSGNNQVSSITVEDSYVACTGGYPVVWYRTGHPGSVNFRNCKVLACPRLCGVASTNKTYPVPSTTAGATYLPTSHVIMIDEATRLSQSNSHNTTSLVDPRLEPFCYDTTSQTSKYKTSIRKNIDYRLMPTRVDSAHVKVTIPVYFDNQPAVANRDLLAFLLVVVSDVNGGSNTYYRAMHTSIVSVIGGTVGGSAKKHIVVTALQDAKGGSSLGTSTAPTVFWGAGNSGSADIAYNNGDGTQNNITITWPSAGTQTSFAYILPLAGIRANQEDKMEFGNW